MENLNKEQIYQLMIAAYIQWLCGMPIVPEYPSRKSLRKNFRLQNPDFWSLSFLKEYSDDGPIVGRGTSGKLDRKHHKDIISCLRRDLYDLYFFEKIMRINKNDFFSLYCLYRLNRLKDIGCMRRSHEDNISSRKDYTQMKMFGLILFLVKRLGTSTHEMNYSVRPLIIHQFMMYVSNKMCSGEKFKHFGFQTGKMMNQYKFQFLHGKNKIILPAFRINFRRRFEILMDYPRELRFAIRLNRFSNFIHVEYGYKFRFPTYVFIDKDLPSNLHPDSVAFVRNASYMLFFQFPKKNSLFAYEYCTRELVRILFGFLIGTSQEKIESAVVELFATSFPRFSSSEAPECFLVVFSLLKICDRLDPEFFKQEADKMLAESIASPILNYFYVEKERKLLKMDRNPIQNILLFVLYWHKRHAPNHDFLITLRFYLHEIQKMI